MSDITIKQKINRVRDTAADLLTMLHYKIRILDGQPFHIEAIRKREIRNIRIVIDEISNDDFYLVADFDGLPENCCKEIWCKEREQRKFRVVPIP